MPRTLRRLSLAWLVVAPALAAAPPVEPLRLVWQFTRAGGFYHPPAIADERLYVAGLDGHVVCLSPDGAVIWDHDTGAACFAGVSVENGLAVTASTNRTLLALDAVTGAVRWTATLDGVPYATPVLAGGRVYVGTGETGTLLCLDAADGAVLWRYALGDRLGSGLVVRDGIVYAGSFDHRLHVLDAADGAVRWIYETPGIVDSMPLVTDDAVYLKLPDDSVTCLDRATGNPRWQRQPETPPIDPSQISNWSNLTLAGGLLLFGSVDMQLHAIDAGNGEPRWTLAGPDAWPAAPLAVGGRLVAGNKNGSLAVIDPADGQAIWAWAGTPAATHPHLRGIMWPPVRAGGRLYASSLDGQLSCFELQAPELLQTPPAPVVTPPAEPPRPEVPMVPEPDRPPAEPDRPMLVDPAVTPAAEPEPPGEASFESTGTPAWKLAFRITNQGLLWPADAAATARVETQESGAGYRLTIGLGRLTVARTDDGGEVVLADQPTPRTPRRVTIHRDGARLRVLYDGEPVCRVWDATYTGGGAAVSIQGGRLKVSDAVLQPVEEIYFEDDFMRAAGQEHGVWQPVSGTWAATGVSEENVRRAEDRRPDAQFSSNPFAYRASDAKDAALAVGGEWFWGEYDVEVSLRPGRRHPDTLGPAGVGLVFCRQDEANYLAFEWDHQDSGHERRLVAVENGRQQILARDDGGWLDDQWSRLGVRITDDGCEVRLDGRPILAAPNPPRGEGQVGLWARGVTFADFDDIRVVSETRLVDRFAADAGPWRAQTGTWAADPAAPGKFDPGVLALRSAEGLAVAGAGDWRDLRVVAVGRAAAGGGLGVGCQVDAAGNGLFLRWGDATAPAGWRNRVTLVRRVEGVESLLAQVDRPLTRDSWHRLSLECCAGLITARADELTLTAVQHDLPGGQVAVLGAGARTAFDSVAAELLPAPAAPAFEPQVAPQFAEDELMADWAQAGGSWLADQAGERGGVIWHRGLFVGDRRLAVRTAVFSRAGIALKLIVAGDGGTPKAGIQLDLTRSGEKNEITADLVIEGEAAGTLLFDPETTETITLELRDGRLLVGDDQGARMARPAPRTRADRRAVGVVPKSIDDPVALLSEIAVETPAGLDSTFAVAPTEWRALAGVWETTNRWKCDPRWSFFGGHGAERPQIVSKESFVGDQQFEAYVGIPMDLHTPPYYLHPSDLGIAICGDGEDPDSGYHLRFAAEQNTCTILYRNGREIARNTTEAARFRFVNAEGEGLIEFHRHWFHLVLRRAGGRLQCLVDDVLLIDVVDKAPLPGGRLSLYAVNNGISVSRVRLYGARTDAAAAWNAAAWRGVEGDVGALPRAVGSRPNPGRRTGRP